jgi:UDP-3-O-acyl N-acetylglucosamine deacetylase
VTQSIKHSRHQQTIARCVAVQGYGFWSGLDIQVEFRPAEPNTGITFVRSDLAGQPRIAASIANQADAQRRTTLAAGNASVEMVEHLIAALVGLNIDNCEVWVSRSEMPGFDGSSAEFVDAILHAGTITQDAVRKVMTISERFRIGNEQSWIEAIPHDQNQPSNSLRITYELDYPNQKQIGRQEISLQIDPMNFRKELAGARTFLLQHEADWLREQGIGRRVTYRDVLVFGKQGLIDNKLHFPDECVRHKALDVLGDLGLIGCDVVGEIRAHRSGHMLNAAMVRELKTRFGRTQRVKAA